MSSTDRVRKARRDVEYMQSALSSVNTGLDTVDAIVETAHEVRRGVRAIVKIGLVLAVVGVAVAIVLKVRRSALDPEPTSTELRSD